MKDVPVVLAQGLVQAAVLERASYKDLLVWQDNIENPSEELLMQQANHTIATSSVRRKAQWLNRHPQATIENIRGNVNTRLKKVKESHWQGAIFAAAGLERIGLRPTSAINLDWMLPAPAQGAIMVVCRGVDESLREAIFVINHSPTEICTAVERNILHLLKGGCSTPISGLGILKGEQLHMKASVLSLDGKEKVEVENSFALTDISNAAAIMVDELLSKGADKIIENLNKDENC
jgi:hydroxymethylbilane synthase